MATWFLKGAEDVMHELGIPLPKIEEMLPEYLIEAKDKYWIPSYRATPFTALFGRYRKTTGGLLRGIKEQFTQQKRETATNERSRPGER